MLFRRRRERAARAVRDAAATGFTVLDRRLPAAETARQLLRKAFPDHWSYLLGELALYSLVVLLLTGSWLTLFFDASMAETVYEGSYAPLRGLRMSQAYASTVGISFDVRGGLLIRQVHHWAALVFVAAAAVHMLRIFFTGAFRRPREANWAIGVTLFMLALFEGFCGYSLPDDLLSGTGLRTANTIVMSLPVVGTYLSWFIWHGAFPGTSLVPRLFIVHVLFVPGALLALVAVHLFLVVYLKHTQWAARGKTNRNAVGQPFFPQFTARSTGLFFIVSGVLVVLGALAQINPVWNYGPYRPDQVASDAQPDWYVGFLEGALRLMPPWENTVAGHTLMANVLVPAVLLPGLLFLLLYAYPLVERWVTGDRGEHHLCDRPRDRPTRTAFGAAAVTCYALLLVAGGNDVIAYTFRVSVEGLTWWLRILVLAGPVAAFLVTKRLCLALQARDRRRLEEGEETGDVAQSVYGGLGESRRPLPAADRYRLLVRDVPLPLEPARRPVTRRRRLREALSTWYYRDRVEMPVTEEQRAQISGRLAGPALEEPGPGADTAAAETTQAQAGQEP
ncbi:menaquinol-cytochrome c reductase cytochrome b subunit [Streptomyces mashuensis]|uniref:Cytochrome bc1 complex cytochrome b subunit n=1 Tax=Streptomyces mashuensis TaxID=33904 RepID=A0A919EF39_9ACTN|nr:ubiquinol-cytochrome c reductase cytochrome b subunit [Streptomyces mashuensis]GHF59686.1 menaquinol-cytochrome c reductase cytochrome b subunit [Streptomyces mashuensis]